jgi:hypothetical protein
MSISADMGLIKKMAAETGQKTAYSGSDFSPGQEFAGT